jgi:phage terminase large subunit-like protein
MIRAGNRTGKTYAGAAEAWWQQIGVHPYRPVRQPGRPRAGFVLCSSFKSYRDAVGKKLWELAPRHLLKPGSNWTASRGWTNDVVELLDGGSIIFRYAGARTVSVASFDADWGWIDESPPESMFGEALTRVATSRGPVWMTFTPIGLPVGYLRRHVEGDPETGEPPREHWEQFIIPLTLEGCPHRTAEDLEAQKVGYLSDEYEQRTRGAWEGITSDRLLRGFIPDCIVDDLPPPGCRWGWGIDHGEGPGKEFAVLVAWNESGIWVVDEYVNAVATGPDQDADGIIDALDRNCLTLQRIHTWIGDVNSAGKAASYPGEAAYVPGTKINRILAAALGRATGHEDRPVVHIRTPSKGPKSVEVGLRMMNSAFAMGFLKVHRRCRNLVRALQHFRGEEELKHGLDATRYVLMDACDLERRVQGRRVRPYQTPDLDAEIPQAGLFVGGT